MNLRVASPRISRQSASEETKRHTPTVLDGKYQIDKLPPKLPQRKNASAPYSEASGSNLARNTALFRSSPQCHVENVKTGQRFIGNPDPRAVQTILDQL